MQNDETSPSWLRTGKRVSRAAARGMADAVERTRAYSRSRVRGLSGRSLAKRVGLTTLTGAIALVAVGLSSPAVYANDVDAARQIANSVAANGADASTPGAKGTEKVPASKDAKSSRSNDRTEDKKSEDKSKGEDKKPERVKPEDMDPADFKPVAGLDDEQMENAVTIIQVGQKMGLTKNGQQIALMTAMQESNLYNLASPVVPDSLDFPHQGTGSDHDSVGLFQQRASGSWGTVEEIMTPKDSAWAFYKVLKSIDYQDMGLGEAAQTVQVSAFPYAYDKHEDRAWEVIEAYYDQ